MGVCGTWAAAVRTGTRGGQEAGAGATPAGGAPGPPVPGLLLPAGAAHPLWGGRPGHRGVVSSIPGPHPLEAGSPHRVTDVPRHHPVPPWPREWTVTALPELEPCSPGGLCAGLREAFLEAAVSESRLGCPGADEGRRAPRWQRGRGWCGSHRQRWCFVPRAVGAGEGPATPGNN